MASTLPTPKAALGRTAQGTSSMSCSRRPMAVATAPVRGSRRQKPGTRIGLDQLTPEAQKAAKKYRTVLALDGGGMRGLIPAEVLVYVEHCIKQAIIDHGLLDEPHKGSIRHPEDFNIDLADFFQLTAGTSTGGLLALYFASKGGSANIDGKMSYTDADGKYMEPGSAANAVQFYKANGEKIFGGWDFVKTARQLRTGGQYKHDNAGLKEVLTQVLGDMTLDDLHSSVAVPSVNSEFRRACTFFHDAVNQHSGFATLLRQRQGLVPHTILMRAIGAQPPELALGKLDPVHEEEFDHAQRVKIQAQGGWFPPVQFTTPLNFALTDVALATSAAPGFLPPVQVTPKWKKDNTGKDDVTDDGWPTIFVDGGLAANDPSWVGLMLMLQQNADIDIKHTAILSIGTGQLTPLAKESAGRKSFALLGLLQFLQDIINTTMSVTGEDKELIMRFLYNGLLHVPEGQYMRVQLKAQPCPVGGASPGGSPTSGAADAEAGEAGDVNLPAVAKTQEDEAEVKALGTMDDPSAPTLDALERLGDRLAHENDVRIKLWVEKFLLGVDQLTADPGKQSVGRPVSQPGARAVAA